MPRGCQRDLVASAQRPNDGKNRTATTAPPRCFSAAGPHVASESTTQDLEEASCRRSSSASTDRTVSTTRSRSPRAWPVAPARDRARARLPIRRRRATSATGTAPPSARGRAADARRATGARRRGLHHDAHDRRHLALEGAAHLGRDRARIARRHRLEPSRRRRQGLRRHHRGAAAPRCAVPGRRGAAGTARGEEISRIAVGWDGSAEATAALDAAVAIARAVGAELRVVEVLDIQGHARDHPRVGSGPRGEPPGAPASASTRSFPPAGGCAARPPS